MSVIDRILKGLYRRLRRLPPPAPLPPLERDVFLLGYPKTGNTWLQVMLRKALVLHFKLEDDWIPQVIHSRATLPEGVPSIEMTHNMQYEESCEKMELDFSRMAGRKIVALIRDPRDMLVSGYIHFTNREPLFSGTIEEFVHSDCWGIDKIVTYYQQVDAARHLFDRVLLVRYEELKLTPGRLVAECMDLFGLDDVSEETIAAAVEYGSFDNMRKMEAEDTLNLFTLRPVRDHDENFRKVRKGKVGGYKEHLSDELVAHIVEKMEVGLPEFFTYPFEPRQA